MVWRASEIIRSIELWQVIVFTIKIEAIYYLGSVEVTLAKGTDLDLDPEVSIGVKIVILDGEIVWYTGLQCVCQILFQYCDVTRWVAEKGCSKNEKPAEWMLTLIERFDGCDQTVYTNAVWSC